LGSSDERTKPEVLDDNAQDRIIEQFWVYEHEWRFLAGYLGEPFLINDCLVFFDGRTVNIAAFPLDRTRRPLDGAALKRILEHLPDPTDLALVHVWGSIEVPRAILVGGLDMGLVHPDSLDLAFDGEYTIDILDFDISRHPEARKALRGVRNKGMTIVTRRLQSFESSHYRIIEKWREANGIGPMAACASSTLPAYCRREHVVVIEARIGEHLCGFVVVALPTADRAVRILSFSKRQPGARIGDALMHATIAYSQENDISTLHCGYGGAPSLSRFKEKWGGKCTGPAYRQAMYAVDDVWRARAADYRFYWPLRLMPQPTGSAQV
jgi:hypothetical protein